ncbi:mechanosensitive ion channel [Saccharibacter sp. 17.LH.SD]|uniref:mechanosensitive ion channel domain-containing protein n=1 Tax=Saccharibacter sp. 17.LH.SD TaxID=2689393 RepID=UPI001367E1D4|nr:mechanosensitive ion channel domain-containing protein [Saccharibacter sp. 17.LH.SD]MXV45030.1 mechanosensitive ion channel [Saccharibacter sp. 17.LH.SD]
MPNRAFSSGRHSPPAHSVRDCWHPIMRLLLLPILLIGFLPAVSHAASDNPATIASSQPKIDAAQAQQLLSVLNDDTKRKQFVTTLTNLSAAQNATKQTSLPDQLLNSLSSFGNQTIQKLHVLGQGIIQFRDIGPWLNKVWHNNDLQTEIFRILVRVVIMIVGSAVLFQAMRFVLRVPREKLSKIAEDSNRRQIHQEAQRLQKVSQTSSSTDDTQNDDGTPPNTAEQTLKDISLEEQLRRQGALSRLLICLRRAPYALGNAALDCLSILMFPLMALLIQSLDPSPDEQTLHSIWTIAWLSGVGMGAWIILLRIFLAPNQPWFRLTILNDYPAKFFYKALRHIGFIIAWGSTALIVLHDCTLPTSVSSGLEKLLALAVHLTIAIMILQSRGIIEHACKQAGRNNKRITSLMQLVARTWWIAALFFDLALWLVWAADIQGGYESILRLFIRTCIALIIMRVISIIFYGGLSRLTRSLSEWKLSKDTQNRVLRYYPLAYRLVSIIMFFLTVLALAIAWGAPVYSLIGHQTLGAQLFSSIITIVIALLVGVVAWEIVNVTIENQIRRLGQQDSAEQKTRMARLRTLQPMFRILLLIILVIVIGLTVLSQLGINTAPLLASASIFGVALGFGSQKLVQDFISGIFLLMENALTVGDSVTLNGTYGAVEKLSLRSVHIRANDGSINIFSFSSLNQVTNYNRDFSRAMIAIDVSYDTDTDEAIRVMLDIAKGMREDPQFAPLIIDDFNLWGVASLNDYSVTIKGTFPTTTSGRWPVEWQFYRRVKKRFEECGIDIPFPTQTLNIHRIDGVKGATEASNHQQSEAKPS